MTTTSVTLEDVLNAQKRLDGKAHRTPVMTSQTLDGIVGANVFCKCENFQRTGAFKFRGAYNAVSLLSREHKSRGVITYSSGNHAQALALVGRLLGVAITVVMPRNAPSTKRAATEAYGATIVTYDPMTQVREQVAAELQQRHGYTLIPPFDHVDVLCGQGTAALELIDAVAALDTILVPCGGGGLLSGTAVAAKGMQPHCKVIGIEPEVADDATTSFRTGVLHTVTNPPTIADGTRTSSLGTITFPLIRSLVDDMQTVSEQSIIDAVRFLFFRMKLVVEPSGALGLAALLSGRLQPKGTIGIILSGGNVDPATMREILHPA